MNYLKYFIFTPTILLICFLSNILFASDLRIIKVHLFYDEEFTSEPNWENNIHDRFIEINKFYNDKFGLHWEITKKSKYNFEGSFKNISDVFSKYKDQITSVLKGSDEEIVICIISRDIEGKGIAGIFSKLVMISNASYLKNMKSGVIIAHELGHLFGAWHTRRADDLMYQRGARYYKAGLETSTIIKLMRNYDFNVLSLLNNPKLLKKISRLYNKFHTTSEADATVRRYSLNEVNPVARLYTDLGIVHFKNKKFFLAVEALESSVKFDAGWGTNRMFLAKAYYYISKYNESFTEFTRAVFYGAARDKEFENKLRNKFIELKKSNPKIIDPFIEDHQN